ncbi:MAG: 16S rRNA (uracil(1498)-N(3))-methyltransferase [Gammaproteobacteria bacterium]|nr:16S rRNA (uracil(1498)-N(3))-methyltransferase [Gammaproteobacteria bacterium]
MREIRLFSGQTLSPRTVIELDRDAGKHASQVLRLKAGADLTLFNGDGKDYFGKILESGKSTRVEILAEKENASESPYKIKLVQGISRSAKMDFTLQKSTELGVTEIQAVICKRSIVNSEQARLEKKLRHWQSVIISACEQSGRSIVPPLAPVCDLDTFLGNVKPDSTTRIMLDPAAGHALASMTPDQPACELLIGPEGGFDPDEVDAAIRAGFVPLSFGPRVLRTETAGLAAIAVLQSRFGDMG